MLFDQKSLVHLVPGPGRLHQKQKYRKTDIVTYRLNSLGADSVQKIYHVKICLKPKTILISFGYLNEVLGIQGQISNR